MSKVAMNDGNINALYQTGEEMECKATWREGSFHYMVAKINHAHAVTDEEKFRCFVYDYSSNRSDTGTELIQSLRLAQSADATCNGLYSPRDGSKTLALTRGKPPRKLI